MPQTISEKILSRQSRQSARAGQIVVCNVDLVIGTDASAPMAIDYFEQMGGSSVFDPSRIFFALDHYAPPASDTTKALHARVREFGQQYGVTVCEVGDGISHQIAVERGRVLPGDLVIGADSHTVTCGALNAFATGVGSSDLAAAMITGQIWLRVPETLRVTLVGWRPRGLSAKDVALALVNEVGGEGANYQAVEFQGPALPQFSIEDRLVLTNLAVEMGAKAAIFPTDAATETYLKGRTQDTLDPVDADSAAVYARDITITLGELSPRIAMPHAPDNVLTLEEAVGLPVQMVFVGTCTGGRVSDIHEVIKVMNRWGGRVGSGVQLVVTPASGEVLSTLQKDGSIEKLKTMGAVITTAGCGACCGTSGVIPSDGMNVLSTANRNFKARMGNPTASIYLASPATCAASAVTGKITDPR